jgi:hypothetical protein
VRDWLGFVGPFDFRLAAAKKLKFLIERGTANANIRSGKSVFRPDIMMATSVGLRSCMTRMAPIEAILFLEKV